MKKLHEYSTVYLIENDTLKEATISTDIAKFSDPKMFKNYGSYTFTFSDGSHRSISGQHAIVTIKVKRQKGGFHISTMSEVCGWGDHLDVYTSRKEAVHKLLLRVTDKIHLQWLELRESHKQLQALIQEFGVTI